MLSKLQGRRALAVQRQVWRAMSTETASVLPARIPDYPAQTSLGEDAEAGSSKASSSKNVKHHGIIVRPWDGLSGMNDVFGIVRGIERRFGRIREYCIVRDFDSRTQYAPYFWARFEDQASYERIPNGQTVIRVEVPVVDPARPGGIGLDDLQGVLQPEDWKGPDQEEPPSLSGQDLTDFQETTGKKVTDVKVEISGMRFHLPVSRAFRKNDDFAFLRAFNEWDGFLKPRADTPASQPWMEKARASWAAKDKREKRARSIAEGTDAATDVSESIAGPDIDYEETDRFPGYEFRGAEEDAAFIEAASEPLSDPPKPLDHPAPQESLQSVQAAGSHSPGQSETVTEAAPHAPDLMESAATAAQGEPEGSVEPETQRQPRPTRRERMLAQAREIARTPLPNAEKLSKPEKARLAEDERKKEEERAKASIKERLWRLMGEKWF